MASLKNSLIGGSLLVAGTSIGAGMLALPVTSALGGFLPALAIFFVCWLFMALTGLFFLEACLWMEIDANMLTMAKNSFGKTGALITTLLYLFLFYSLTIAYLVGGGEFLQLMLPKAVPVQLSSVIYLLLFAPFVCIGTSVLGRINMVMMAGLGISYAAFIAFGANQIDTELLQRSNWSYSLIGLPIAFTSFAYQGVIPSLFNYFQRDYHQTRKAILIGSFIPFLIYAIWEGLVLGIVPLEGPDGLLSTLQAGKSSIHPLSNALNSPMLLLFSQSFAFCAVTTSFFGVALGLKDFLTDLLKTVKGDAPAPLLWALIFGPPLLITLGYPSIFLRALNMAGGFGCALLLGLLPLLIVWIGRYKQKLTAPYQVFGGKLLLSILILLVLGEVVLELAQELGWTAIPAATEAL